MAAPNQPSQYRPKQLTGNPTQDAASLNEALLVAFNHIYELNQRVATLEAAPPANVVK